MVNEGLVEYKSLVMDSTRWVGFVHRDDDIVISTPPKCGTTWTQMICALLIFQTPKLPASLDQLSPWLDMLTRDRDDVVADLDRQQHRRFIKTHTGLDGLTYDERVTYVVVGRDPRDVGLSWDNHMANMNIETILDARAAAVGLEDIADMLAEGPPPRAPEAIERFWKWVDDAPIPGPSSLGGALHHLSTFWAAKDRSNVVFLHYDDLKTDLGGQMRMLADRLGIQVPETTWPELVEAATFDSMRQHADVTAPDTTHAIWHDNKQFFNKGLSGQWRDLLNADDVDRYFRRVAELAPEDLAAWVHNDQAPT